MQDIFNPPDADLILRTADGTQFRVFRRILAEASPFFKDMLSLPQPAADQHTTAPVVDVEESSETIYALLRLIYPVSDPEIHSLDDLATLLHVSIKYDMVRAIATLRRLLVSPCFLAQVPMRVYAIASRHDLEEEARIASTHILRVNIEDCELSEDLKFITGYSYHRLIILHRKRAAAAQALIQPDDTIKCMQCNSLHYRSRYPKWWSEFEPRAKEELKLRPTSDVVFSMEFLAQSTKTDCVHCAVSVLESHAFLARLKGCIDALPSTI